MKIIHITIMLLCTTLFELKSEHFETYKLSNGATVILIPENHRPQIHSAIVCLTNQTENPSKTMAYNIILSRMLSMGTQTLGTTNGALEMLHYKRIIEYSNRFDLETNSKNRADLEAKIFEENNSALHYIINGEASLLMRSTTANNSMKCELGSTIFYASFFPSMLERYLDLRSTQLSDLVFRDFENQKQLIGKQFMRQLERSSIFDNIIHTATQRISYNEVIKEINDATLSNIIEYYRHNYNAENMALILTGNFDCNNIKPIIEKKFNRLNRAPQPSDLYKNRLKINKPRTSIEGLYATYGAVYNTTYPYSKEWATQQCLAKLITNKRIGILSNSKEKGNIQFSSTTLSGLAYPTFTFSNKQIEKLLLDRLSEIGKGAFDDSLFLGIKQLVANEYTLQLEKKTETLEMAIAAFVNKWNEINFEVPKINIYDTKRAEVQEMANAWLIQHKRLKCSKMEFEKSNEKSNVSRMSPPKGRSRYANYFDSIPVAFYKPNSIDFASVSDSLIAKGVKLKHCLNAYNELFTLKFTFSPTQKITTLLNKTGNTVRYEKITPAEVTLKDFDTKLIQNGCTYTFESNAKPSLILTGNNKSFDEDVKLISALIKNVNISDSNYDVLKKKHKKFLKRVYPKKVDADSLSKIYAATFHSLSDVSYYGTRPQSEISDIIINNFGLEKISSKNNIETNTFKFDYDPISTIVSLSIKSKPVNKTDKMQLMVIDAYYNIMLWNHIREQLALSYQLSSRISTPVKNNLQVYFDFSVYTKPDQVFEVAKAVTNLAKNMPTDSVVFEKAKQIVFSRIKSSKPHFRDITVRVRDLKEKGFLQDELLTDLEMLQNVTLESTNAFFKSKFINQPCNLKISGGLLKIGKSKLDDFKKEYIK